MADPTLNGIALNKLQRIGNELNGNIIPIPMPGGDSSETETFDMLGVTRIISLSGVFVGTTSEIKTKITNIEAIVDGDQESSVNLVTDELGTISVKVASIATNWSVEGISNRCEYRIMCIQGA